MNNKKQYKKQQNSVSYFNYTFVLTESYMPISNIFLKKFKDQQNQIKVTN